MGAPALAFKVPILLNELYKLKSAVKHHFTREPVSNANTHFRARRARCFCAGKPIAINTFGQHLVVQLRPLTRAQLEDIAKAKEADLTAADLDAAVRTIAGSARSMGLKVEG